MKTRHSLITSDIDGVEVLAELALDMRWSWSNEADEVWNTLDHDLWNATYNPWIVLQTVSRDRMRSVLEDPVFRRKIDDLVSARRETEQASAWFQQQHAPAELKGVAYFSMEFMLSEALPIYSGGLGNVAGDQLKTASDLGIPVAGIGLLYQQGYFRQLVDRNGAQEALFPYNDPGQLPIMPVREPNGEWLRLEIALPGFSVWLRAWEVQVGRVRLYLLDSNDAANFPPHRGITSELYGGGTELRLKQELALGIGGVRLLETLGIMPEVFHLNEGHAAFAVLERARSFMKATGQRFDVALAATRAGNLFTTHTAVASGFDSFSPSLIQHYLGAYAEQSLRISITDLLALGRQNPHDPIEPFNMAYLAVRGSRSINGVSRLHGNRSRKIFQPLFVRWPECEVPVGYVTNGVHMPSWESPEADELWSTACHEERWLHTVEGLEREIRRAPDSALWQLRSTARKSLVDYIRERLSQQLVVAGASEDEVQDAKRILDPGVLTLVFARRFAAYKRPTLLLQDPGRLVRILNDSVHPAQLIIAGKAHPADTAGQDMIRQWVQFVRRPEVRHRAVFLSDYDMWLTGRLVQGADVWINTPRRPWEACSTSGMKVLVNGGLNLSERDGWWDEAYSPDTGWALGDGADHGDDPAWDATEAEALYTVLEREVAPEFYTRDSGGIPTAWVARIRESMARLTPRFSANRTVREYTEHYYLPAAAAYRSRSADNGALAQRLLGWERDLRQHWPKLKFSEVRIRTDGLDHIFEVHVHLGGLDPNAIRVEIYADEVAHQTLLRQELHAESVGVDGARIYVGRVAASRPAGDYTARIIPRFEGAAIPLEAPHILWQH